MAAVGLGNLRLLLGMVRANRPWRLVAGLSRTIVGALGVDIFGVGSPDVWMIADGMISLTYIGSGALLLATAFLFRDGTLDASTQTTAWAVICFFASAGASAAYLTVSEVFPMETRAIAIAVFYAFGTALGGIVGPTLFGALIQSGRLTDVFWGYVVGAALMIAAGIVEIFLGVEAAGRPLEEIATPLSAEEAESVDRRARAGGRFRKHGTPAR